MKKSKGSSQDKGLGISIEVVYVVLIVSILLLSVLLWENRYSMVTGFSVNGIPKVEITDIEDAVNNGQIIDAEPVKRDVRGLYNAATMKSYVNRTISNRTDITANLTEVFDSIDAAVEDVISMNNSGFSIVFVTDSLLVMKQAILDADFNLVIEMSRTIRQRKERAFFIGDSINVIKSEIDEEKKNDLNVSSAEIILESAIDAFDKDIYNEAEDLILDTSRELDEIRAQITMIDVIAKASRGFFARNWIKITIVLIILAIIFASSYNRTRVYLARRKLDMLEREIDIVLSLMKKAQMDHFRGGPLSGPNYNIKMEFYKGRIAEIKKTIPVLESTIAGIKGNVKR